MHTLAMTDYNKRKDFMNKIIIHMKEGEHLKFKKYARAFLGANLLLLVAFTFLPVLILNPDLDVFQSILNYMNKD